MHVSERCITREVDERGDGMAIYRCSQCGYENIGPWFPEKCPKWVTKEESERKERLSGGYQS